jgi:hypothetical protein
MITNSDELLHEHKKSVDWQESYVFNFIDKKNKLFCFADIDYFSRKSNIQMRWFCFYNNKEYRFNENVDKTSGHSGDKFKSRGLKYTFNPGEEDFKLLFKNSVMDINLDVNPIHHTYDYPIAVDMEVDKVREKYEQILWKRFEQRCRFKGTLKPKSGENKGKILDINCSGQRERKWGKRLWGELIAYSTYYMQFRDMAFSLAYHDFGDAIISSGYISKKSGNIPVYETELEHIEVKPGRNFAEGSEISYKDSQDDKDLIVDADATAHE